MVQCCFPTQFYVQNWMSHEVTLTKKNFSPPGILMFLTVLCSLLLAKYKNNNSTIEKTTIAIIIAKLKKLPLHVS